MTGRNINYKRSIAPQSDDNGTSKSHPVIKKGTQSIYRAILLLKTVGEAEERGLRLGQIADTVHLPIATVHRILNVLVSEGLLEYDPALKSYHIGIGLYSLGSKATHFALRAKYRACLTKIARETKNSVYLLVKSGLDALCIDSIQEESLIRIMTYTAGSREPLGIGAGSLALLAFSSDEEVTFILEANRLRYAKNKDASTINLKARIHRARRLGFVFNKGTYMKGINALGLPLFEQTGEVAAAISVASIAEQIDFGRSKEIADLIKFEISEIE